MPRERDPPYIAAGFRNDAEKLLDRFVAKKSLKFADFAEVWRDLHFTTIFMGRESLRELTEFIEECYRNALLFMDASDPYQKVGTVYLLYSLYLKQPSLLLKSQVPIRVSFRQVFEIYNVENHFLEGSICNDDVLDLTYIVTKLFKMEAFSICCFPIPMGPSVPMSLLKLEPLRSSCFKEMLGVFRMLNENDVQAIGELSRIQEGLKKQLPFFGGTLEEAREFSKFEEVKRTIDQLEDRYNAGLFPNEIRTLYPNEGQEQSGQNPSQEKSNERKKTSEDMELDKEFRSLGQRRALLKAQQFEMVAEYGRSVKRARSSSESSKSSPEAPVKRGRGRPKKQKVKRKLKKVVEGVVKTGHGANCDSVQAQTEADTENVQTEAEVVDNTERLHPVPYFPYRRPTKYPRPVRKLYFEDNEENEEGAH